MWCVLEILDDHYAKIDGQFLLRDKDLTVKGYISGEYSELS